MPYFHTDDINILFIHIPKTGGTSLEYYLSKKYNIKLNKKSLHSAMLIEYYSKYKINLTLQHYTYNNIVEFNNILNVNFENLKKITIVRNPYSRIISDLFYIKLININSTKEYVFDIITNYINDNKYDNHNIPQYTYIIDDQNNILNDIQIFKTETLNDDIINYGYTDFNININTNKHKINYIDYLNNNSILVINNFYDKDFNYFNYDKINTSYISFNKFNNIFKLNKIRFNQPIILSDYQPQQNEEPIPEIIINGYNNNIFKPNKIKFNQPIILSDYQPIIHLEIDQHIPKPKLNMCINNRYKLNSNLFNKSI